MKRALYLIFALTIAAPAFAAPPSLEPGASQAATQRYLIGRQLYVDGDIAGAAREFESAILLHPNSPKLAFNLARCRERLGEFEAAVKWYSHYMSLDPTGDDLSDLIIGLELKIAQAQPVLLISTIPPGATLFVDDAVEPTANLSPTKVTLSAGSHVVRAVLEGYEPRAATLELRPGVEETVHLQLVAVNVEGPVLVQLERPNLAGPIAVGAAGILVTGAGLYFLGQAAQNSDDAARVGPAAATRAQVDGLEDDFDRNQRLGMIFTGVGLAALGGGLSWWLLQDSPAITAIPTTDGVVLQGQF